MVTALKFFLSNEPNAEEEDSSDEEDEKEKSKKVSNLVRSNTVSSAAKTASAYKFKTFYV